MDKAVLEKMLKMMSSGNDTDAVMGLRSAQGLFESEGVGFSQAVLYAAENLGALKSASRMTIEQAAPPVVKNTAPVTVSGMPQCRAPRPGHIEIILAGKTAGEIVALPGAAAEQADIIAASMKDALVAAAINKSRFKLKLVDVKDTAETALQAEYEREGMSPVRIWVNIKGEVAALATVLRRYVANTVPELLAA